MFLENILFSGEILLYLIGYSDLDFCLALDLGPKIIIFYVV